MRFSALTYSMWLHDELIEKKNIFLFLEGENIYLCARISRNN